jgi:hypothetical protein
MLYRIRCNAVLEFESDPPFRVPQESVAEGEIVTQTPISKLWSYHAAGRRHQALIRRTPGRVSGQPLTSEMNSPITPPQPSISRPGTEAENIRSVRKSFQSLQSYSGVGSVRRRMNIRSSRRRVWRPSSDTSAVQRKQSADMSRKLQLRRFVIEPGHDDVVAGRAADDTAHPAVQRVDPGGSPGQATI